MPPRNWDDEDAFWDEDDAVWDQDEPEPPTVPAPPARKGRVTNTPIETNIPKLLKQARDAEDGARRRGTVIGLLAYTADRIKAALDDLVAKVALYKDADDASSDSQTALTLALSNGRGALSRTVGRLKPFLGDKPNTEWEKAGWSVRSIAVPSTEALVVPTLDAASAYLADHPDYEDDNPKVNVTAANLAAKSAAIKTARSAIIVQDKATDDALIARNLSVDKLRSCLRGLQEEMNRLLDPMSSEYLTFGFKKPGAPDAPAKVKNTRATALGGGRVQISGDAPPDSDTFQFWGKTQGTDEDFLLLDPGTPMHDPIKTVEGYTAGAVVKFKMRAVNETGEGPFGDEVTVTIT